LITITIFTLITRAVSSSETSVNIYKTARHNNAGDSHLHACRRKNLKSLHDSSCFTAIVTNEAYVIIVTMMMMIMMILLWWREEEVIRRKCEKITTKIILQIMTFVPLRHSLKVTVGTEVKYIGKR
jgi:hypothetical protein